MRFLECFWQYPLTFSIALLISSVYFVLPLFVFLFLLRKIKITRKTLLFLIVIGLLALYLYPKGLTHYGWSNYYCDDIYPETKQEKGCIGLKITSCSWLPEGGCALTCFGIPLEIK